MVCTAVNSGVGVQQAERGEHRRGGGDDDLGDVALARDLGGEQPARAAEGHHRELARIVAAIDRERADGVGHLDGRQAVDPGRGGLVDGEPELAAEPCPSIAVVAAVAASSGIVPPRK